MTDTNNIILLKNISKSYSQGNQSRPVLDNINLTVSKGEIIAIIGRSGSGKSTLLNIMSGIDMPDQGTVNISHQVINQLTEYDRTCYRRKHMGFVFQFFNLIPTLTVKENIQLPLELNQSLNTKNKLHVLYLLEKVGLSDYINHYPDQLSGGEQQRVAILRAIVHRPNILFADEPTGNLDTQSGRVILDLLQSMARDYETTLILVTHSTDVANIANRTFKMHDNALILHE